MLHGEIWQRSGEFNYVVGDNVTNVVPFIQNEENPNKILSQQMYLGMQGTICKL